MLDMYQHYTPKPTNTYGDEERCASDQSWLALYSNTVALQKAPGMQLAFDGHFERAVWIDVTSINMSYFFTVIKTSSLSCN